MKKTTSTVTTEGPIPHYPLSAVLVAPVKVKFPLGVKMLPAPDRRDGKLAYALPGGGELVA